METNIFSYILLICYIVFPALVNCANPNPKNFIVWGPGLVKDAVLPVRYIFIQTVDEHGNNFTESLEINDFSASFSNPESGYSRIFSKYIDIKDGTYILMFRMHQSYADLSIDIKYKGEDVANSPYTFMGMMYNEHCYCPVELEYWLKTMNCESNYPQMDEELNRLPVINATQAKEEFQYYFKNPGSSSIVNYVIKNNKIYRRTWGQHVQFKTFIDSTLLSLTRKVTFPDMEFFFNLGDYSLVRKRYIKPLPMFAWGAEEDSYELILPSYIIMTDTLNHLHSTYLSTLDMHSKGPLWTEKIEKAFFRGRDSSLARMKLYFMSKDNPELIDANITRMFFFNWENVTTTPDVPFYDFYNYKYIINMDGTVAPYRTPYLLGSRSLILKEESNSYEFFYKKMIPNYHYISFKTDLSDLIEKINWAQQNDDEAEKIALRAQKFALENILPEHLYCYHISYFQKYQKRLVSEVKIHDDMEHVEQELNKGCQCKTTLQKEDL